MSGNVYEWCWDRYEEELKDGENPSGPESVYTRVLRGGSYSSYEVFSRVDYRCYCEPYCDYDTRFGISLIRNSL